MAEEQGRLSSPFAAVITARLTSNFGTYLSMIALNVYMLELTDSPTWMGLTLAVKVLSGIAATPFIGHAVDRMDRKKLMVFSDLTLAAAMLLLVVLPLPWMKGYIVLLMALLGVFSTLFDTALNAATPVILGSRDTLRANSWLIGGRNLVVAGAGLCAAGAGFLFKGYNAIFIIDAATYLVSAGVLGLLSMRTSEGRAAVEAPAAGLMDKLRSGFQEIDRLPNSRTVALFLLILLLDTFASGSHNIGWPVFSKILRPEKPMFYYGFILFFYAWGNVAGIYQLNRMAWLQRLRPETLYLAFTAIMSAGMILIFQTRLPWFIALASFVAGVGDGTYQTYFTTYMQQVPDAVRGKIFALSGLAVRTGFSVGFLAAPLALQSLSVAAVAALFHGLVLAAIAAVFILRPYKERTL
ncbi:MAG: MFS transporter [Elusimicrobia bacterium]|nr:MFS transporter [Elusimicrobiota bacterium]